METRLTTDISQAATLLQKGAVIAIPTETVYGLAANALEAEAVRKIFELKKRPSSDPLIVHVRGPEALEGIVAGIPDWAYKLMMRFWPGPLTLLLPKGPAIPEEVTAGLPRVAVRAPAHPLTQALLQAVPFPLAAPSANPFGRVSPTTPEHVGEYFAGQIPLILDGGPCAAGIESTIIGEEHGRLVLYRPGALPREVLEEALGEKLYTRTHVTSTPPVTPGQFPRHYAPNKPLLYGWRTPPPEKNASIVVFEPVPFSHPYLHYLPAEEKLADAAAQLYPTLLTCEKEPTHYILVQAVSPHGLGEALHDRLRRASLPHLFTIGHSNHPWAEFQALLQKYEIHAILDLRKQPYSRYVPHFSQGPLQKALHEINIAYEWQPNPNRLLPTVEKLLREYLHVALLCAEGDPNRCHRFSLSDTLTEKGFAIFHILPTGELHLHRAPISLSLEEKAS